MTPPDDYGSRGWRIVLVPSGGKNPNRQGWPKDDPSFEQVEAHVAGGGNLGVILGPKSGEIVDIDLDCLEAIALADLYLPPTAAIFGRPSKPRSHRLYIAAGAVYETFADPTDGTMLVELRAQGRDGGAHQTLLPPSIADGERREWHGNTIDPAVIDRRALRIAVAWLAVGCLVMRHLSTYAAQCPGPDLPDLLMEADLQLGEAARKWLAIPEPRLRHRSELRPEEIDLEEMVAAIPNRESWDGWVAIGLAIYAETHGSDHGAIVFDDWSAKSPKYNPYNTTAKWREFGRYPPNRTGVGKLVKLALAAGWRPKGRARA